MTSVPPRPLTTRHLELLAVAVALPSQRALVEASLLRFPEMGTKAANAAWRAA